MYIVWGAQQFHTDSYRRRVTLETDYKLLDKIFLDSSKSSPTVLTENLLVILSHSVKQKIILNLILLKSLDLKAGR